MEKELLNKNVEVLVSFVKGIGDTGALPVLYIGTFLNYDENYYKVQITDSKLSYHGPTGKFTTGPFKNEISDEGIIYLRKEFVIYIKEI